MKKIILLFTLCAVASCSEGFLDSPKPQDTVSPSVIYSNKEAAQSAMSGILRESRGQFLRTDAANIGSIFYARSLKGNDVISAPAWFLNDYSQDNRQPTYVRTEFTWKYPYYLIGKINAFLEGVEGSSELSQEDKNHLLAQGLAYRGFLYFQLSLEFQNTYLHDINAMAPPIYTKSSQEMEPMSKMVDLYNLITSDLNKAVTLGAEAGGELDGSYWNKRSASAVLAQVYQVMGEWQKAKDAANFAYGGDVEQALDAESYGNGFNNFEKSPEWLWFTPQKDDQSAYYWTAPFAFVDHKATSYNATYFNEDFVRLFSPTDVRNLFEQVSETGYNQYITTKFVFNFASDVPIIRKPEMVLIEAESLYRLGDESKAHEVLYKLQHNRDPRAVKSNNTGDALLEEILVERRKELYCENGVEWFDAKRLQRGIKRTGNHRVMVDLEPNDKRFYLLIPQKEIDANDFIGKEVNDGR